jgi:hypothetical protein
MLHGLDELAGLGRDELTGYRRFDRNALKARASGGGSMSRYRLSVICQADARDERPSRAIAQYTF